MKLWHFIVIINTIVNEFDFGTKKIYYLKIILQFKQILQWKQIEKK